MPTSIGHALAGAAVGWGADLITGRRAWRVAPATAAWYQRAGSGLTLACVLLAVLPDADLAFGTHRTYSHSIGAVIIVAILAAAWAARRDRPVARIALTCAAAYATHLLLDWTATDIVAPRGIQAFWPFTTDWYISGWNLFKQTERRRFLSPPTLSMNALASLQELLILAPVTLAIWLVRVKALARLSAEMSGRHQPPK